MVQATAAAASQSEAPQIKGKATNTKTNNVQPIAVKPEDNSAAKARPVIIRQTKKSKAVMVKDVKMGSLMCQSILRRHIEFITFKLFNLSVIIPVLSTSDAQAEAIEDALDKLFSRCEADLAAGIGQISALLTQQEITKLCEWRGEKVKPVEIDNPHTHRYITCLEMLDELQRHLETAWISGLVKNLERKKLMSTWREKIMKLQRAVIGLEGRARGAIRNKKLIDEAVEAGGMIEDTVNEQADLQELETLEA